MISTLKHLAFILKVDPTELESIRKNTGRFYYEVKELKYDKNGRVKVKKNGEPKVRVLNPSFGRLKVIQKRIQEKILSSITMPDYVYGAVKGKDNVLNAKRHKGNKYNFTTDLTDYFPSISNNHVFRMFRALSFSPIVSKCLTELTTYKGRLPQGVPTSSTISNLVFIKTGLKLEALAKSNDMTFTTFIDDITFSAKVDFKEKVSQIIDIIIQDGFRISHSKTFYKTSKPIVTGVVVGNNYLGITDKLREKMQMKENKTAEQLEGLEQYVIKIKRANARISKSPNQS